LATASDVKHTYYDKSGVLARMTHAMLRRNADNRASA
jgi:hypothetical protein